MESIAHENQRDGERHTQRITEMNKAYIGHAWVDSMDLLAAQWQLGKRPELRAFGPLLKLGTRKTDARKAPGTGVKF